MANYPIWIGCEIDGTPLVGADAIDAVDIMGRPADRERVYGSQIRHRVCAEVWPGLWEIMTPTDAAAIGARQTRPFPGRPALGR